jgi:putative transposase
MLKAFKYRLYLTKAQRKALRNMLCEARWLYNKLLEQRKTLWENDKQSISCFEQQKLIPQFKIERPTLKAAFSQVLQDVAKRLERAMQGFFRRVKRGETPGYPRFRGHHRYNSITFPQVPTGCKITADGQLAVSGIGNVAMVYHRPLGGKPKTATISCSPTGKWYVSFSCECDPNILPKLDNAVGIDMGVESFATTDEGMKVPNPKFFRKEQKALAKVQRKLAKQAKGTKERAKARKAVARVHERIGWRRSDFAHKQAWFFVKNFQIICTEGLNIDRMVDDSEFPGERKSIYDVAWGQFLALLSAKAAEAGRDHVQVNPAYTSQDCSGCCQNRQQMPRKVRIYVCPKCGMILCRDINAARNILALGLQSLRAARRLLEAPGFSRGE